MHLLVHTRYRGVAVGVIVVIFESRARLSLSQPIEIKLSSEDLVEAFQDNGDFNTYLSEKPYVNSPESRNTGLLGKDDGPRDLKFINVERHSFMRVSTSPHVLISYL
jgi:hypothetical protein